MARKIKDVANLFVEALCKHIYEDYLDRILDGQSEYQSYINGWRNNKFRVSIWDEGSDVCYSLYGLSKVNFSAKVDLEYLVSLSIDDDNEYEFLLKELIKIINEEGYSPDRVEIECTYNRVVSLKIEKYAKNGDIKTKVLL